MQIIQHSRELNPGHVSNCPTQALLIIIFFLAHQHKAAGVKIKLSKNNDHDRYHTASNVARKATAFNLLFNYYNYY